MDWEKNGLGEKMDRSHEREKRYICKIDDVKNIFDEWGRIVQQHILRTTDHCNDIVHKMFQVHQGH